MLNYIQLHPWLNFYEKINKLLKSNKALIFYITWNISNNCISKYICLLMSSNTLRNGIINCYVIYITHIINRKPTNTSNHNKINGIILC